MTINILETNKLCVGYPHADILSNVDIALKQGETVGLIGLNGAGKTTLLKTLLGLRKEKSGSFTMDTALYDAKAIANDAIAALAYLPEKFEPPAFLTGYEFIDFSLKVYGRHMARDEIRKSVHDLAFDVEFLDKKVSSYSKGMRQKIGFLATVLTGCSLMILDEPMSGLDPFSRSLVKDLIKSEKEKGRSFLISSHVLSDMEEICERIAVVDSGHVAFFGEPSEFIALHKGDNLERSFMNLILHNRSA
jgi:ABC-2 type transport system ATP-binding protein